MSKCRYCSKEITWLKEGGKLSPIESDGGTHRCEVYLKQKESLKKLEVQNIDPELLAQYQKAINDKVKK